VPVPFSTAKVTALDTTPVLLLTWQRSDRSFDIYVRNDSDTGRLHITNSPTGTIDNAYTVEPRDLFGFTVPTGPAYGSSPTESLYVFAAPGRTVTASAFIEPH